MEMTWIQIIILGLVQGAAEVLPLSGAGFSAITRSLMGVSLEGGPGLYGALIQLAVVAPICLVFHRDFRNMRQSTRHRRGRLPEEVRLARRTRALLALGAMPMLVPVALTGALNRMGQSLPRVSLLLLLGGTVLFACDRVSRGSRDARSATLADGLVVGIAQAVGCVPGLSRTGLALSAGIAMGLSPSFALRYGFYLAVPALILQAAAQLLLSVRSGFRFHPAYVPGMALAALSSYGALRLLRFLVRRDAAGGFAYCMWGAGMLGWIVYLIC